MKTVPYHDLEIADDPELAAPAAWDPPVDAPPDRPASDTAAWLLVTGACTGCLPLRRPVTRIGRADPDADYRPDLDLAADDAVSRRHLEVRLSEGEALAVDVGSTNGTLLNGELLSPQQPHLLQPGDRLAVGGATVLTFLGADPAQSGSTVGARSTGASTARVGAGAIAPRGANLTRQVAAMQTEIRRLEEELATAQRCRSPLDSELGRRTVGQVLAELEAARDYLRQRDELATALRQAAAAEAEQSVAARRREAEELQAAATRCLEEAEQEAARIRAAAGAGPAGEKEALALTRRLAALTAAIGRAEIELAALAARQHQSGQQVGGHEPAPSPAAGLP
jgi:hypothetical protein